MKDFWIILIVFSLFGCSATSNDSKLLEYYNEDELNQIDQLVKCFENKIQDYYQTNNLSVAYEKYLKNLPSYSDNNFSVNKEDSLVSIDLFKEIWKIEDFSDIEIASISVGNSSSDNEKVRLMINSNSRFSKYFLNEKNEEYNYFFNFIKKEGDIHPGLLSKRMLQSFSEVNYLDFDIRFFIAVTFHYRLVYYDYLNENMEKQ